MSVDISKVNVLSVNATVIIGLIILFTFQSISSSFIETESSNFILEWQRVQNELATQDSFLEECKILREDRDRYEQIFLQAHEFYFSDGSEGNLFDRLDENMEKKIRTYCDELVIKGMDKYLELQAIEDLGYHLNYLSLFDDYGNEYSYMNGYDYYEDYGVDVYIGESTYFYNIATGPLWVNITNMIMIFPFTISAIIASFNLMRHNESEKASKAAVMSMAVGFGIMLFGLVSIVSGILTVYQPFMN